MTNSFDAEYTKATREAELGRSTCRVCGNKAALSDHITVLFGGGLLYALCLQCVNKGESILIQNTERGIGVLRKTSNPSLIVAATTRDINAIKKRVG